VVCRQAKADQDLAAFFAVLFQEDNQRLFARQNFFQQRHIPAVKGQ